MDDAKEKLKGLAYSWDMNAGLRELQQKMGEKVWGKLNRLWESSQIGAKVASIQTKQAEVVNQKLIERNVGIESRREVIDWLLSKASEPEFSQLQVELSKLLAEKVDG